MAGLGPAVHAGRAETPPAIAVQDEHPELDARVKRGMTRGRAAVNSGRVPPELEWTDT